MWSHEKGESLLVVWVSKGINAEVDGRPSLEPSPSPLKFILTSHLTFTPNLSLTIIITQALHLSAWQVVKLQRDNVAEAIKNEEDEIDAITRTLDEQAATFC